MKLFVAALDGSIKKQIIGDVSHINDNVGSLVWSPDNKYLITNDPTIEKFQLINRDNWQIEKTIEFEELGQVGDVVFSSDNSTIYFTAIKGKNGTPDYALDVFSYILNSGKVNQLIDKKISGAKLKPRISSDGKYIVVFITHITKF